MPSIRQNFPAPEQKAENISVLLVGELAESSGVLRRILPQPDWQLIPCDCVKEAADRLSTERCSIILCDPNLRDGTWRDILQATEGQECPPLLLVASEHADYTLWGEVLNLGGYDVLLKPFDASEVTRVLQMAWRQWRAAMQSPAFA